MLTEQQKEAVKEYLLRNYEENANYSQDLNPTSVNEMSDYKLLLTLKDEADTRDKYRYRWINAIFKSCDVYEIAKKLHII